MALKLITPPSAEPLDLPTAKAHLRVDGTDDDALITSMITTARRYCEGFQNRAYITQVWEMWLDSWPDDDKIEIDLPPLQSVISVKYYGTDDTEYTLAATEYMVDTVSFKGRVILRYGKTWPTITLRPANAIVIRFQAGYGDAATNVPAEAKQAMLLIIGHLYANREETVEKALSSIPLGAKDLLSMSRVMPL